MRYSGVSLYLTYMYQLSIVPSMKDSIPLLDNISTTVAVIPVVIVVIILIASLVAFFLRRKAVAGTLDVEKGNKEIRGR